MTYVTKLLIEIVMEYEDMLKRQNPKQDISWLSSVGTDDSVPTTFGELRQLLRAGNNTRTA